MPADHDGAAGRWCEREQARWEATVAAGRVRGGCVRWLHATAACGGCARWRSCGVAAALRAAAAAAVAAARTRREHQLEEVDELVRVRADDIVALSTDFDEALVVL